MELVDGRGQIRTEHGLRNPASRLDRPSFTSRVHIIHPYLGTHNYRSHDKDHLQVL